MLGDAVGGCHMSHMKSEFAHAISVHRIRGTFSKNSPEMMCDKCDSVTVICFVSIS